MVADEGTDRIPDRKLTAQKDQRGASQGYCQRAGAHCEQAEAEAAEHRDAARHQQVASSRLPSAPAARRLRRPSTRHNLGARTATTRALGQGEQENGQIPRTEHTAQRQRTCGERFFHLGSADFTLVPILPAVHLAQTDSLSAPTQRRSSSLGPRLRRGYQTHEPMSGAPVKEEVAAEPAPAPAPAAA